MISKAAFCKPSGLESWRNFLNGLQEESTHGIFLMVAENTFFDYTILQPLFKEYKTLIFGGIFPGVIFEDDYYIEGVIGCSIGQPIHLEAIQSLEQFVPSNDTQGSMLILVDGRTYHIANFLYKIFETSGNGRGFIGGGAGSLHNQQQPVLFSQEGWLEQGAIIVRTTSFIGVGVGHGWQPMFGPLVVNSSEGNEIKEINWQKAFPYYQQLLWEKEKVRVEQANFFAVAKNYPFGMVKMDGSIIVRDPIRVEENGSIILVGEMPQNSIIMLLHGDKKHLISAAGEAVEQALTRYFELTNNKGKYVLMVDCISRALFLGEDFQKELRLIRQRIPKGIPLIGFLSFGEIGSNGDKYLEFYNKTTVVGVL
ncbi:FIST signal transduction protein [Desulforamulus ferrireducens]|uniref:Histidine kinase n=1 Tax=Desulforamulus ferrireducens TaxID=1833852 RepID=A0A1S6IVW4_9FIRM|nr:FIST C-terminal domain-containing protein [Desulforamulus ferrireducens]AQS58914.1 histidine kinase [Desulforamulus ferrireducens]